MGYSPQGHKESDRTEVTEHAHVHRRNSMVYSVPRPYLNPVRAETVRHPAALQRSWAKQGAHIKSVK